MTQKAYLKEWEHENDERSHVLGDDKAHPISRTTGSTKLQTAGKDEWNTTRQPPCDVPSLPKSSRQAVGESDAPSWKHTGTHETLYFGNHWAYHCFLKNFVCNFIHTKQFGLLPKSLILLYPDEEILSRHEEDVSSIRDGFSAWVTTDRESTLRRHIVDVKGANAAFREAPASKHSTSAKSFTLTTTCPTD